MLETHIEQLLAQAACAEGSVLHKERSHIQDAEACFSPGLLQSLTVSGDAQGGELNVLLQLPWVNAEVLKRISRKGGARGVAELLGMGEQERLELFVTSGEGS